MKIFSKDNTIIESNSIKPEYNNTNADYNYENNNKDGNELANRWKDNEVQEFLKKRILEKNPNLAYTTVCS